jgi:hypothetical protein
VPLFVGTRRPGVGALERICHHLHVGRVCGGRFGIYLGIGPAFTERVTRSQSLVDFSERIAIFIHCTRPWLHQHAGLHSLFPSKVAYDAMTGIISTFCSVAAHESIHELVMIYFEDVDHPPHLNLGNVFESGSQDTRLSRAKTSAESHYRITNFRAGGANQRDHNIPAGCPAPSNPTVSRSGRTLSGPFLLHFRPLSTSLLFTF